MAKTTKKKTTTKKTQRAVKKAVKKAAKKNPGLVIAAVVIVAAVVVAGVILYQKGIISFPVPPTDETSSQKHESHSHVDIAGVKYDDFQVHFLELGNWYTGDSVFIKAGDTDILIDAGSRYNSAEAISSYVDQYCTDGKLEYVIATHAHEDHIAGFSGGASKNGIFYKYDIGTIIEFAKCGKEGAPLTSGVYTNYCEARDYAVSKGAKCITALEASKSEEYKTISIGENMTMTTLYQRYYEDWASTENNYSVCSLFTYKEHNFLFTGDLEKAGETSLAEKNDLPQCELYKAGHHGSKTSSNEVLLEKIKPEVVCCCACAGSDEYTKTDINQFPTQEFVDRIKDYTDNVFVTTLSTDNENKKYTSMNGTILFSSNGKDYAVACSNNNTILKDTEWFKAHRTW